MSDGIRDTYVASKRFALGVLLLVAGMELVAFTVCELDY